MELLAGCLWGDAALLESLGFLCLPQALELGKAPGVDGGSRAGLFSREEPPMDVKGRDGPRHLSSKSQNGLGWKDPKSPLIPWAGVAPAPSHRGAGSQAGRELKWESTNPLSVVLRVLFVSTRMRTAIAAFPTSVLLALAGTCELSHLLSADTRAVKTEPCPHCWLCLALLLPTQPSFQLGTGCRFMWKQQEPSGISPRMGSSGRLLAGFWQS